MKVGEFLALVLLLGFVAMAGSQVYWKTVDSREASNTVQTVVVDKYVTSWRNNDRFNLIVERHLASGEKAVRTIRVDVGDWMEN